MFIIIMLNYNTLNKKKDSLKRSNPGHPHDIELTEKQDDRGMIALDEFYRFKITPNF